MLRALLLESLHPVATSILRAEGVEVITRTGALDDDELAEALQGVHLLGIRSKTQVTERVLDRAPDLLAVGAYCIGTNQIDLGAAARLPFSALEVVLGDETGTNATTNAAAGEN